MLDSIYKTWRWPRVVDKVEHDPKNPLEYAKIWRIAQQSAASGKQIKFGTCSAQVLAFFLDSHTPGYDLDDKMQLTWDMAEAMNLELRQLVAAGCKVIQIEEPTLHFMACYYPNETKLLDFLVDCFNREIEGLDDAEVWIHTCWGNPNMQKVFSDESYANSVEIYLDRLKGDVWTIEASENDLKELPLFGPHRDSLKKKIAVGVISHRTLQADFPDVVAERVRKALEYIPADKLILSTDCGFGRQGFNRHLAFYKAAAIPQARNIVLKELGARGALHRGLRRAAGLGSAAGRRAVHASQAAALTSTRGRTGTMQLSCGDHSFPVLPHEQTVELVKMLGFDAFDLAVMGNRSHVRPEDIRDDIPGWAGPARGAHPRARARDRRRVLHPVDRLRDRWRRTTPTPPSASAARRSSATCSSSRCGIGAPGLTMVPGLDLPHESHDESLARAAEELGRRADEARAAGVRFSIEPHVGSVCGTPEDVARLVELAPGLELTLDYTHYVSQGFADAEVEPLVAHARHFHARGGAPGRVQCALKDSTIDYGRAVDALREAGYDGALAVEYVWIDWERCNECDNVSETIILRDRLLAALARARVDVPRLVYLSLRVPVHLIVAPTLCAKRLA